MKWLRLYDDLLDDPKVQKLPAPLFRHWINLLCLANKGAIRGVLPDMADIAFRLRVEEDRAEEIVAALTAAGLIECDGAGQLHPHNWETRQAASDDVNKRVAEYRARAKNGNADVTLQGNEVVTLPTLSSVTVTREEAEQSREQTQNRAEQSRAESREVVTVAEVPALPALPSVVNDLPAPALPDAAGKAIDSVLKPIDADDLLKARPPTGGTCYNLQELAWGCMIVLQRKTPPENAKKLLYTSILPEVRKGRRPESASNGVHAPPEKQTKPPMPPELKAWQEEYNRISPEERLARFEAELNSLPAARA